MLSRPVVWCRLEMAGAVLDCSERLREENTPSQAHIYNEIWSDPTFTHSTHKSASLDVPC